MQMYESVSVLFTYLHIIFSHNTCTHPDTVSGFQSLRVQSLRENQKPERKQQPWFLPKRILIQSAVCAKESSPQETNCSSTLKKPDMLYTSQCPALRLELVGPVTILEERAREESDHLLLTSHGVQDIILPTNSEKKNKHLLFTLGNKILSSHHFHLQS